MKLNLDNYRVFRDVCAASDHGLSLGALGVLSVFVFSNARDQDIESLMQKSPDDKETILKFVSELIDKGYLFDSDR